nr:CSLREA domain-containing protein [uncultured Psychroserpens sp.]
MKSPFFGLRNRLLLTCVAFMLTFFQVQAQTTFTVTKAEDTNDGVCDADCSLREALQVAHQTNGDNIIEFSTLFDSPQTITLLLGQLEIGPPSGGHGGDYIINGPGQDLLTIDGNLQHRVFYAGFGHIDVEINNLTIANGKPDQPGTDNDSQPYPQWGGGIMKLGGDAGSYCRLVNVTIENCEALRGGAISSYGGNMYLDGVTLRNNHSDGYGSAIEEEGRIFEIKNSAIYGNTGASPIRMHASIADVDFKMENSTISGNTTPSGASAIEFITNGGRTQIHNIDSNTITNNTSDSDGVAGAAITFGGTGTIDGTMDNSIVSGNLANGSPSDIGSDLFDADSDYNLIGTGATQIAGPNNILNVNDPLLAPLADNGGNTLSHTPYGNSPALNEGFTSLTIDQVGNARGIFGASDIGSMELQSIGSYVVTKTEDTNDGVCDTDCSLREAFIAANNDAGTDVIEFSSLFNSPQTIMVRAPEYLDPNNTSSPVLFGQMEVGAAGGFGGSLIIQGPGQDLLTIDGDNASRVFYNGFAHLNLSISDLTIANGNSSTIQGPYTTYGGGILLLGTNTTTLNNVTIASCTSPNGGAISSWTGTINLDGVTLRDNSASYGAAIESEAGTLNINNSAIVNNSGAEALIVWASNSSSSQTFIINNSTVSGNTAPTGGSAIETRTNSGRTTTMIITNSTITNNTTEGSGNSAAISHQGALNATTWTAHNSIISGNTAEDAPADLAFHDFAEGSSYNIIGTGTAITDGTDNNIVGVDDPLLVPLTDNGGNTLSHLFYENSPAYNNGNSSESTDQIGNPRNQDGGYDIGAVEFTPPLFRGRVFLQGAALNRSTNDGEENLMRDDLRVSDLIPTTSPYSDGLTCDSSVFAAIDDESIVDWIWVEFRDKDDNTNIVHGQSALLNRSGYILGVNGQNNLRPSLPKGDYYIVIKHRNHLGIMTASPITINNNTALIDFADTNNDITYGTNAQSTFGMPEDISSMWAGDANNDGIVQYSGGIPDNPSILSFALNDAGNFLNLPTHPVNEYSKNDVNMNGIIQYAGGDSELPFILQNVIAYPGNFLGLSTWPIMEQLPENFTGGGGRYMEQRNEFENSKN